MAQPINVFRAQPAGTVSLAVTATTGSVAMTGNASVYRLYNAGTALIFVEFGISSVTATTSTGMPIAAGATEWLRAPNAATAPYVAAITSSGTATLYATAGEGQ